MGKREAGSIYISLRLATAELNANVATVERQLGKLGRTAGRLGQQMSAAFSLPLAGLGAASIKAFSSFDKALTQSMSVMNDASDAMKNQLGQSAIDLSKKFAFSATELAKSYYALGAAGLDAAQAQKALPVVAEFATAGQFELAKASTYLVDIQNALGLSSKDAAKNMANMARISDVLTRSSRETNVTIEDLAGSLAGKLGGQLRALNIPLETGTAALEAFGAQGVKGEAAGTALGIVLRDITSKAIKNAEAWKAAGVNVFDAQGNFRNLIDIISDLEKHLLPMSSKMEVATLKTLGFADRSRQFTQALIGMSEQMRVWEKSNKSAFGDSAEVARKNLAAFEDQMKMVWNRITAVAITIGSDLAPSFYALADGAAKVAEWFQKLSPETRVIAENVGVMLAVVGPLSIAVRYLAGILASVFNVARTLVGGFAAVVSGAASMAAGIVAAVGVVPTTIAVATIAVYTFWDDIKDKASEYFDWFKKNFPETGVIVEAFGIKTKDIWDDIVDYGKKAFSEFADFLEGWATATADSMRSAFETLWDGIKKGFAAVQSLGASGGGFAAGKIGSPNASVPLPDLGLGQWAQSVVAAKKAAEELSKLKLDTKAPEMVLGSIQRMVPSATELLKLVAEVNTGLGGTETNAKKAAKALADLKKQFVSEKNATIIQSLQDQIDTAIESGNQVQFTNLRDKLIAAIKEGTLEGLADKVKEAGPEGAKLAQQIAEQNAQQAAEKYDEKMKDASIKSAKQVKEDLKKAHEEAVSFYEDAFSKLFSGDGFDFKAVFRDLATGLASEIAAGIFGGVGEGVKSIKDMGQYLGAAIIGSISPTTPPPGAIGQNLDGTFMVPNAQGGTDNVPGQNNAGYFAAGLQVVGAALSANKNNKGNEAGTGGAIGAAGGTAIGAAIGGPAGAAIGANIGQAVGSAIGGMFKHGPQNPETKARKAFGGWIEEQFKKLGAVSFFDAKGALQTTKGSAFDFITGPNNRFNDGSWADKLNSMGDKARATFLGLGEALKDVAGITENVGSQIAFMLSEQFGGNIDNARLLVQQLNIDMDTLVTKLVEGGRSGAQTWLEVETEIQGLGEAFAPGLVAIGDVKGAFDELMGSGGRGVAAIKSIKDLAIETLEASGKSIADVKALEDKIANAKDDKSKKADQALLDSINNISLLADQLAKAGVNQEDIAAIMDTLASRGVTTLSSLAEASDRTAGSIVAGINAASETMANTWQNMADQLDGVKKKLDEIPEKVTSSIQLDVSANLSNDARLVLESGASGATGTSISGVTKFARGGIIKSPTMMMGGGSLGLAGEAGPEALMPLVPTSRGLAVRSVGGDVGRGGTTIVVNAPNAAPGMEVKIARAIKEMGAMAVAQAVDQVNRRGTQGGRGGVAF